MIKNYTRNYIVLFFFLLLNNFLFFIFRMNKTLTSVSVNFFHHQIVNEKVFVNYALQDFFGEFFILFKLSENH
jgi:hypothetical protein